MLSKQTSDLSDCSIDSFLNQGFLIFRQSDLLEKISQTNLKNYLDSIISLRAKSKDFFDLNEQVKRQFYSEKEFKLQGEGYGYYPGWWPVSAYDDIDEGVDFRMEYLMTHNFYNFREQNPFSDRTFADNDAVKQYENILPNLEAHKIGEFLDRYVLSRVKTEFVNTLDIDVKINYMQIQVAYYQEATSISKHTDASFLQAVIGPTTDFIVTPFQSNQSVSVSLDVGEIILYPGRAFQKKMNLVKTKLPTALVHQVEAKAGRMSILTGFYCQ